MQQHNSNERPCLNTAKRVAKGVGDHNITLLVVALLMQHNYAKGTDHCP